MSNGKRSLSIKQKFIAALVVSGGIVAIMIGGVSYYVARDTAIGEVQSSLVYPLSQRATLLDTYEQSVRSDMFFMTHVRDVGRSIGQFSKSFAATDEASGQGTVAKAFVEDNPHPADRRSLLDKPAAAGKYGTAHSLVHPMIRAFLEARGYYDVFLIAPDGLINYSVAKEADFGTNLVSGPYAASGLGRAFASATKLKEGEAVFVDFEGYAPSNGAPAAFVATPIYASAGFGKPKKFQGVLAFQVPAEHLERAIMAETENSPIQTFLLGSDNLVRTNVAGVPGEEAMKSQFSFADNYVNGTMITSTGLDGYPALVASQPVTFFGIPWRIVSQQSTKTAMAGITTLRNEMLTAGLPILLLLSAMAWYLGRSLARPILAIDSRLATMTEGDIETPVPGQDRGDEIGSMARNAEAFRHKIAESEAARQAQVERDSQIEQEREAMMADLEAGVGAVVTAVTRGELNTRVDRIDAQALRITATFQMQRRGVEAKIIMGAATPQVDLILVKNILMARRWYESIKAGASFGAIAKQEKTTPSRIQQMIRLAFLDPDILDQIAAGRQPVTFTSERFKCRQLPEDGDLQRKLIGEHRDGKGCTAGVLSLF